jgi:hypothetical protein
MSRDIEDVMRANPIQQHSDQLQDADKIKRIGNEFHKMLDRFDGREISIAKTKLEEAVMWAVKGVTE